MEINSPQPEHAQLSCPRVHPKTAVSGRLLAALHQQVVKATSTEHHIFGVSTSTGIDGASGSIDGALLEPAITENQLIPSPPLSPKLVAHDVDNAFDEDSVKTSESSEHHDSMLVRPLYDSEISPRRYRTAMLGFLAQYRCVDLSRSHKRSSANSNYKTLRRTRNYTLSSTGHFSNHSGNSDFERSYRTRRVTGGLANGAGPRGHLVGTLELSRDPTPVISRPSTPTSRHRKAALVSSPLASAATVNAPNMNWERLPDYSPSVSLLPNNNKCLKVEWKGSSMDLSDDPLRDRLHPAELQLAQILRLPCDLYLDSKRRLFLEKMHRLKQGLPFRRTDAQKACRIDVNKASRLFAAYEKIGWLQDDKFEQFL
ncbi:LAME_0B01574g1_1 [Lachancea meyersii CBS 8951]|uniref:LAME_0B01574g1_1 n=1 Tax=Lachancea meyersii CBS 8951 TaxID=1266667 RepID=A0A1G4ITS5_9SACH|nr:LAME_0B01574g1_1 [Lachancea meyersii CBS 8951]